MELLKSLPTVSDKTKSELLDILLREEYGYLPSAPDSIKAEVVERDELFCAGKAVLEKIILSCKGEWGEFSFPVYYTSLRNKSKKSPCFIHINFRDNVPDKYQPTEELVDEGFGILSFCYQDITSDNGDFGDGFAGVIYPNGRSEKTQCGKIGLWAWAAMRVMDYAQTLPEIDKDKICVAGHSRLGKTALLTGALDERFFCAFSNDSGNSGAAIARDCTGEDIKYICETFPYWFCENYYKYAGKEHEMPFDQHYLIGANYPHRVYVASAEGDIWATPDNEYISCVAASEFYQKQGKTGFVHPQRLPKEGEFFHDGMIGYHRRGGLHYFSREDWGMYIKYLRKCGF